MKKLENKVRCLLLKLGVDPSLDGYKYLLDAIVLYMIDPKSRVSFTKQIYPRVADQNGKDPCHVERSMRVAIKKMQRKNPDFQKVLLSPPAGVDGIYKNSQFVCACVEIIKIDGLSD